MKFLKKINKGFILTLIVLIALICYIVNLEVGRNKEKGAIQEACINYLAFENKYTVLPTEYQNFDNKMPEDKLTEYKNEIKTELKKLMVDDENIVNAQISLVEEKLDEQVNGVMIYTARNSKLMQISKFEFEDDQVTVTIEDSMQTEYMTKNEEIQGEKEPKKQTKTEKIQDQITLKKVNGEWKVIYASVGMTNDMYTMFM